MRFLLLPLLSLLWTAFVFHQGVRLLSPEGNPKIDRVTLWDTFGIALGFAVFGWLVAALGWIPVLGTVAWIGYALVWLGVFAVHFGMGWIRAMGMAVLQALAGVAFHLAASWLWPA